MKRRDFIKNSLDTISMFALLESVWALDAINYKIYPNFKHWITQLNEYCLDLKTASISQQEWQLKVHELFSKVDYEDVLKNIDFKNLIKGFQYPDLGVATKPVVFPKLKGVPNDVVFIKKIFGMKKDRTIIPHGHSNMVSSHLVLKGEMHLRQYDKIKEEKKHLIIQPTVDEIATLGQSSSISDEKNNVHWFIANSNTAFTFDVIMVDLKEKPYDIHNLDIYKKENLSNGCLRVPKLGVEEALKKYGKQTHH